MMETRRRRRWFEPGAGSPQKQAPRSVISSCMAGPAAAWPKPPPNEHNGPAMGPRQMQIRQWNAARQHKPTHSKADGKGSEAAGTVRRCPRTGELKPQPPAAARSNAASKSRTKAPKDVAAKSASPSKPDQNTRKAACLQPLQLNSPTMECSHSTVGCITPGAVAAAEAKATAAATSAAVVMTTTVKPKVPAVCTSSKTGRASTLRTGKAAQATAAVPAAAAAAVRSSLHHSRQHLSMSSQRAGRVVAANDSSTQQQLYAALNALQQQQQHEPMSPAASSGKRSSTGCSLAQQLRQQLRSARCAAAAAAAAAIQEVLLMDRGLELLQEFQDVQRAAAVAEPAQQVSCVGAFTAVSSKLQELLNKQQQQQQGMQLEHHLQQHGQQRQQQQQHSPHMQAPHMQHRTPQPVLVAPVDESCEHWGMVTNNALFVSTPASSCSPFASPCKQHSNAAAAATAGYTATAAATARGDSSSCDKCSPFQPLQSALHAVRSSQQRGVRAVLQQQQQNHQQQHHNHQQQQPQSLVLTWQQEEQQQQQYLRPRQALLGLQDMMLQWFVPYIDKDLCRRSSSSLTRRECIDTLKTLSMAQQWLQEQLGEQEAADGAAVVHLGKQNNKFVKGLPGSAATASEGQDAASRSPSSQLQQLQVTLRKKLVHFGYLQFHLPS